MMTRGENLGKDCFLENQFNFNIKFFIIELTVTNLFFQL